MGQIPATIGKCRMCGIGIVVTYIGKDGILCCYHKGIVRDLKMKLKKSDSKTQLVFIPTDKIVTIVKDTMPTEEGGFRPGQKFKGEDTNGMFQHCAFTEGTLIKIDGYDYIVSTMETKDGGKRQVPIPNKKKL